MDSPITKPHCNTISNSYIRVRLSSFRLIYRYSLQPSKSTIFFLFGVTDRLILKLFLTQIFAGCNPNLPQSFLLAIVYSKISIFLNSPHFDQKCHQYFVNLMSYA